MLFEVLAGVGVVKFAVSGNVISCSVVLCCKRLGENRILHLSYRIMFRKNLLRKPESEGRNLLTDFAPTYTTIRRLIPENSNLNTIIATSLYQFNHHVSCLTTGP